MTCEGATSRGSAPKRVTVVIWAVVLGLAVSTVDDGQDLLPRLLLALPVTYGAVVAAVALRGRQDDPLSVWRSGLAAAAVVAIMGGAVSLAGALHGGLAVAPALALVPARVGIALVLITFAAAGGWAPRRRVVLSGVRRALLAVLASSLLGGFLVVPASTATAAASDPAA